MTDLNKSWQQCLCTNAVVNAVYHRINVGRGSDETNPLIDFSPDDLKRIILCQDEQLKVVRKKVTELDAIAPKRLRGPDGTIYTWRCPDELVPIKEL